MIDLVIWLLFFAAAVLAVARLSRRGPGDPPSTETRLQPRGRSMVVAATLLASVALSITGQRYLAESSNPLDGALLFVGAVGAFLWALDRRQHPGSEAARLGPNPSPEPAEPVGQAAEARAPRRMVQTGIVLLLAVLAWATFGGNRFTALNLSLWLASIGVFIGTFAEGPRLDWGNWRRGLAWSPDFSFRLSWPALALVAIVVLGAFFRFHQLEQTPAEMTSDHAEELLDVWDVMHGQWRIFFPRNTGRELLQFYATAASTTVLGIPLNHLALKIPMAAFGVLTIPWAYLLGKQLFNREVGLLAAALTAMSQWATAIDRIGLRFPLDAAFVTPTLYFLVKAFERNRRNDWLLCGLFLGAGLHTYTPFRIMPFLLVALLAIKLAFDLARVRLPPLVERGEPDEPAPEETSALSLSFWKNVALAAGATFLVFLPLGRYMQEFPQSFWFRALSRVGEVERPIPGNALVIFADNVKNAMLMFNYRGDQVAINTVPGSPVLDMISGALFVLGMTYLLWRVLKHRERRGVYMLTMLFFLLLPSTTSIAFPAENPGVGRTGGAIPIVMIIVASASYVAAQGLHRGVGDLAPGAPRIRAIVSGGMIGLLLIPAVRLNYDWYFIRYDTQWRNTGWNTTEMGAVVHGFATSIGDLGHAFHVPYPHWADTRAIGINAGDPAWENALQLDRPEGVQRLREQAADRASKLYIVHPSDRASLDLLRRTYPNGLPKLYQSARPNRDFWIFLAPGLGQPA